MNEIQILPTLTPPREKMSSEDGVIDSESEHNNILSVF